MKKFVDPDIEVEKFRVEDILSTSDGKDPDQGEEI